MGPQVLTDMAQSIGGKPWWNINRGYYQIAGGAKTFVKGVVTYKGYAAVPNNGLCWQARARSIAQPGRDLLDCDDAASKPCMRADPTRTCRTDSDRSRLVAAGQLMLRGLVNCWPAYREGSAACQPGKRKAGGLTHLKRLAACTSGVRAAQGLTISDDQVFAVVDCLLRQGRLPYSADAVYTFLAASSVTNPGVQRLPPLAPTPAA